MKEHFTSYNSDFRAKFANEIFKLLYHAFDGDFNNVLFLQKIGTMYDYLDDYVRNIYEVIDDEIPMMAYYQVLVHGSDGYNEWEEYETPEALKIIESYCHKHYCG